MLLKKSLYQLLFDFLATLQAKASFTKIIFYSRTILLLMLSLKVSVQTILRLPCGHVFADFKLYEIGKALSGSVIQTNTGTNELDCIQSCTGHKNCLSYNVNPGEKKCELNSKTRYHEGAALLSKPGWIYKSTDYNETLVCML